MTLTYTGAINNRIAYKYKPVPTLTFKGEESQKLPIDEISMYGYKNILPEKLVAAPNPNLKEILKKDTTIHNLDLAYTRLTSFSRYLKESMVGFVTPEGKQWFQDACTFLIKGSAGVNIPEIKYQEHARELWGLLVKVDPYWKSNEFINYLKTLEQNAGITSTINALLSLKKEEYKSSGISFGYDSAIRFMPELCRSGCAYTSKPLNMYASADENYPTLEHLFPHSEGGDEVNVDSNFVLALGESNGSRGNIPLIDYLKGWNSDEYYQIAPRWKQYKKSQLQPIFDRENEIIRISKKGKKQAVKILEELDAGKTNVNKNILTTEVQNILKFTINERNKIDKEARDFITHLFNNEDCDFQNSSTLVQTRIRFLLARQQLTNIAANLQVVLNHLVSPLKEEVLKQLKDLRISQTKAQELLGQDQIDINQLPQQISKNIFSRLDQLFLDSTLSEYNKFKNNQPFDISNMTYAVKHFAIDYFTNLAKTDSKAKEMLENINQSKSNSSKPIEPDELPNEIKEKIDTYYKEVLKVNRLFSTRFAMCDYNLLHSTDKSSFSSTLKKRMRDIEEAHKAIDALSNNPDYKFSKNSDLITIIFGLTKPSPEYNLLRRAIINKDELYAKNLPKDIHEGLINYLNNLISNEADVKDAIEKTSNRTTPTPINALPKFARKYAVEKLIARCKSKQSRNELMHHIIETQPIYVKELPESVGSSVISDLKQICNDQEKVIEILTKYDDKEPIDISELPLTIQNNILKQLKLDEQQGTIDIEIPKQISIKKQTNKNSIEIQAEAKVIIEKILGKQEIVDLNTIPLPIKNQVIFEMSRSALDKIESGKSLTISELPVEVINQLTNAIETQYLNAVQAETIIENSSKNGCQAYTLESLPIALYRMVIADVGSFKNATEVDEKKFEAFKQGYSVDCSKLSKEFTNYLITKIQSQPEISSQDKIIIYKLKCNKVLKNTELKDIEERLNLNLNEKLVEIINDNKEASNFIENYSHGESHAMAHLPDKANNINKYLTQLSKYKPVLEILCSKLKTNQSIEYSELPEIIQKSIVKSLNNNLKLDQSIL